MTRTHASPALLEVSNIETCYGRSQVLFGVSLTVAAGEMVSLLGRNGMGKTTTVRSIMGRTSAILGVDLRRRLLHYRVARYGIGLVPEGRHVFPNTATPE